MTTSKQQIIDAIIEREGGYVNDPSDSGGETNFGITERVARANGYTGAMRDMPRSVAFDTYEAKYWVAVRADDMPPSIAEEVVDTAVNMGVRRAGRLLQRSLNALTDGGLDVDGAIGPATIQALNGYLTKRDEQTLLKALNCLQGAYYVELVERRPKDRRFIYGWLKNRIEL